MAQQLLDRLSRQIVIATYLGWAFLAADQLMKGFMPVAQAASFATYEIHNFLVRYSHKG